MAVRLAQNPNFPQALEENRALRTENERLSNELALALQAPTEAARRRNAKASARGAFQTAVDAAAAFSAERISELERRLSSEQEAHKATRERQGRLIEELAAQLGVVEEEHRVALSRVEARAAAAEAEAARLRKEGKAKDETIERQARRLADSSATSGTPSSQDGPAARAKADLIRKGRRTARAARGKRPQGGRRGGQAGHPGRHRPLDPDPDAVVDLRAGRCGCGQRLSDKDKVGAEDVRQTVEPPAKSRPVTTEYRASACRCPKCRRVVPPKPFPDFVRARVQFGQRSCALFLFLLYVMMLPVGRCLAILRLSGLDPSAAALLGGARRLVEWHRPLIDEIHRRAAAAERKGTDATTIRIGAVARWLHVVATRAYTALSIRAGPSDFPEITGGWLMHDGAPAYYNSPLVSPDEHQQCGAHFLRYLRAVVEIEKEPWAQEATDLLLAGLTLSIRAGEDGLSAEESHPAETNSIRAKLRGLLQAAIAFHEAMPPLEPTVPRGEDGRPLRNADGTPRKPAPPPKRPPHVLASRMSKQLDDLLRFLSVADADFTNNLSEQAFRMLKARQRASGCFQSLAGAERAVDARTLTETMRLQGMPILESLCVNPFELISRLSDDPTPHRRRCAAVSFPASKSTAA